MEEIKQQIKARENWENEGHKVRGNLRMNNIRKEEHKECKMKNIYVYWILFKICLLTDSGGP